MECGSAASAHAEANASALQTGQRAAPLSHAVGEGLGVRAKKGTPLSHTVGEGLGVRATTAYFLRRRRPSKPAKPAPSASKLAGSGITSNCWVNTAAVLVLDPST